MLNRDARDMVVALRGKPSRQPEQREQARALAVLRSPELMAGPVAAAIALDPGHRVGEAIRDTLAGLKERKAPSASGSRPGRGRRRRPASGHCKRPRVQTGDPDGRGRRGWPTGAHI